MSKKAAIKLAPEEEVVKVISRSAIGIAFIWLAVGLTIVLMLYLLSILGSLNFDAAGLRLMNGVLIIVLIAIVAIGLVQSYIYRHNTFTVTNQRVIQESMSSLFSKSLNVVNLESIEDVSYKQSNPIQMIFHYGVLRLSTVGDETTYTFTFADSSEEDVAQISELIHIAKDLLDENNSSHQK
jgi:hypothetical protein